MYVYTYTYKQVESFTVKVIHTEIPNREKYWKRKNLESWCYDEEYDDKFSA